MGVAGWWLAEIVVFVRKDTGAPRAITGSHLDGYFSGNDYSVTTAALAKQRAKETGDRYTLEASIAKLFASETSMYCANEAVQIQCGIGYSKELPIERYFRDAQVTEIYEGTSEIQQMVIARLETGLR